LHHNGRSIAQLHSDRFERLKPREVRALAVAGAGRVRLVGPVERAGHGQCGHRPGVAAHEELNILDEDPQALIAI
jgi:hypothetical protein